MERSKKINLDRRSKLTILLLHQSYLVRKIKTSHSQQWSVWLTELVGVQQEIQAWYRKVAEKIQHQSRVNEFHMSEQTRIYHHAIHQKHMTKTFILKLKTDIGVIEVHGHLENLVADLLLNPAELDSSAQDILLN